MGLIGEKVGFIGKAPLLQAGLESILDFTRLWLSPAHLAVVAQMRRYLRAFLVSHRGLPALFQQCHFN